MVDAAQIADLDAKWKSLVAQRDALGDRYLAGEVDLLPQIKDLNAEIKAVITQLDGLGGETPAQTDVQTVSNIPLPLTPEPQDTNTDPETQTFAQNQSVAATTEGGPVATTFGSASGTDLEVAYDSGPATPTAIGSPGNGAEDDNPQQANATSTTNSNSNSNSATTTQAGSNTTAGSQDYSGVIKPRSNVLDLYASYTWSASLYLMSSQQYTQFITTRKKNLTGYNLLIQSGGAPVNKTGYVGNTQTEVFYENNGVTSTTTANAGRSPAFPLDFYIDNISFTSQLNGKGTGQAHGTSNLKFQITEPNGITLLDRLYSAVQDAAPRNAAGPIDYQQAQYLMVMRWYGFDENGNPAKPPAQGADLRTDPRAIVEKFIPFTIRNVNFTVSNRLVTYDFDCAPVGQLVAGSGRSGTVTSDVELTGKTVKDVLAGNPGVTVTRDTQATQADIRRVDNAIQNNTAPSMSSGAPIVGASSAVGLIQAMNSWQQELVKNGTREYADTYEIVFAPGAEAIQNAEILLKDPSSNQSATPMGAPTTTSPDSALPEKQAVSYNGRNLFVTAGTQMLYAIDYIIRNSKYIANQATVAATETNDPYTVQSKAGNTAVQWYNISMEAIPDGDKYDHKINSPVYKIRYVINAFTVQNFVSRFFPNVPWLGVHKTYPYWFTGQNVAVIDYQATFNRMYQLIVSGSTPGNNAQNTILQQRSSSMLDQIKWYVAPRSSQSTTGAESRGNEIPAEAAEYLYDPSSLAEAKVRIIGDPAWIQQGSVIGTASIDSYAAPFLPDGTINFDGGQPMFEIAWQKPQDYNIDTGLADPYKTKDRNPVQSFIYTGRTVTSEFRGGKFEQLLIGNLYPFPNPSGTNTAPDSKNNTTSGTAQRTGVDLSNAAGRAARSAAAVFDTRRLDRIGGGAQTTGESVKTQPGANNDNGTRPAPETVGAVSPGGGYDADQNGVMPADVVVAQSAPSVPDSDGTDVAWFDYEPPPKLGGQGDNSDPPQSMVLET